MPSNAQPLLTQSQELWLYYVEFHMWRNLTLFYTPGKAWPPPRISCVAQRRVPAAEPREHFRGCPCLAVGYPPTHMLLCAITLECRSSQSRAPR